MTAELGKQTIAVQILLNMQNKDNQTIKFGQLIKCSTRKSFLEKS